MRRLLIALVLSCTTATSANEAWESYGSVDLGVEIMAPADYTFEKSVLENGWQRDTVVTDHAMFHIVGCIGAEASPYELKAHLARLTGVSDARWTELRRANHERGWRWFVHVQAVDADRLLQAVYGIGPHATYILYFETSSAELEAHGPEYGTWLETIEFR